MLGEDRRWGDLENALWRAINGSRLGARSHTVAGAMKALSAVSKTPWTLAGVSRETWRRWGLQPGQKNAQKPSRRTEAGLLAALRRRRLSSSREAKIRGGQVTVKATSNYDGEKRTFGGRNLDWAPGGSDRLMDAYLTHGIRAAAQAFMDAVREDSHCKPWLDPANTSGESYDVDSIDLTSGPGRGSTRRR